MQTLVVGEWEITFPLWTVVISEPWHANRLMHAMIYAGSGPYEVAFPLFTTRMAATLWMESRDADQTAKWEVVLIDSGVLPVFFHLHESWGAKMVAVNPGFARFFPAERYVSFADIEAALRAAEG